MMTAREHIFVCSINNELSQGGALDGDLFKRAARAAGTQKVGVLLSRPAVQRALALDPNHSESVNRFNTIVWQLIEGTHPLCQTQEFRFGGFLAGLRIAAAALIRPNRKIVVEQPMQERSTEELQHFTDHGEWPNREEEEK
jgi:hypothetical protein